MAVVFWKSVENKTEKLMKTLLLILKRGGNLGENNTLSIFL